MLPSGEIDVLGIRADDILVLDEAKIMEHWRSTQSLMRKAGTLSSPLIKLNGLPSPCQCSFAYVKDTLVLLTA
eukprot:1093914-Pyramimonas_sp.AAC.1